MISSRPSFASSYSSEYVGDSAFACRNVADVNAVDVAYSLDQLSDLGLAAKVV